MALTPRTWRPDSVLRFLSLLFLSMAVGGLLLSLGPGVGDAVHGKPNGPAQLAIFCVGLASFQLMTVILAARLVREHDGDWRTFFGLTTGPARQVLGVAFAATLVSIPLTLLLGHFSSIVMKTVGLDPSPQQAVRTLQAADALWERVLFGLGAVAAAPIAEELLFRGILFRAIRDAGWPRLSLWGTAVLFAATHSNLATFLPLTAFALVLATAYATTGNLLTPILTHSLFNLINFVWMLLNPDSLPSGH